MPRAGRVGAAHGGAAGRRRADGTPTGRFAQETIDLVLSKASNTLVLNDSPEARTSKILCKSVEGQNPRFTSGLFAVYPRDDGRSSFLAAYQWIDAFFVFCKLFSCKGCPPAYDPWSSRRTTAALIFWWLTKVPPLNCLCEVSSCNVCSGILSNMPCMKRVYGDS